MLTGTSDQAVSSTAYNQVVEVDHRVGVIPNTSGRFRQCVPPAVAFKGELMLPLVTAEKEVFWLHVTPDQLYTLVKSGRELLIDYRSSLGQPLENETTYVGAT